MNIDDALPSQDAELFRRVDEVAHYIWDPIGVCDLPSARDEYSGYLLGLYGKAKTGDATEIVDFLRWVETDRIGLAFKRTRAERAAGTIVAWVKQLQHISD